MVGLSAWQHASGGRAHGQEDEINTISLVADSEVDGDDEEYYRSAVGFVAKLEADDYREANDRRCVGVMSADRRMRGTAS